ncbi:hypothetical protein Vadar_006116 [Vaccinium darrowii]|uniref:Uncharacterized protein n=1 Tax=Vaccinium darrowii TaxID=229202 RepID=A0ACB7YKM1_9ERIC|nr:hypothetical protein Vadar_006116 [Vaccinium darrowii]
MTRKCRLWWPTVLSTTEPKSSILLFGWFVSSSSTSLEIVVAFGCDEVSFAPHQSRLQGLLHETSESMSMSLQDKCSFSLLGHCAVSRSSKGRLMPVGVIEDDQNHEISSTHTNGCTDSCQNRLGENLCMVQLVMSVEKSSGSQNCITCIGTGKQCPILISTYVILYETPIFGSHHFSVRIQRSEQVKAPLKKPKWVEELHQKQPLLDLDTAVMAINSAYAAKLCFEKLVGPTSSTALFPIFFMCVTLLRKLWAVSVASFSTLFYLLFQFLHVLLSSVLQSWMYLTLEKVFTNTWKNIQIRRCQILYWPIVLKDNILRSQSCVEYAEKAALHKHSTWSSVAMDILLGYLFGIALFFHAESASLWVSNSANDLTNSLLRNGCVWLMGVPAGFKLNTELAGVLGMISLNAIQIWSTLWYFVGSLFIYFVRGLAIAGVLFGLTTPAALVIDMISLATLHVSTLHFLISHVYSYQIKAIAALWRLFRGRKLNPLRQRYDSYDYTVEQHIVGSLLFTPLLLLLPTTSVFYIFFTIMKSTISFICLAIDIVICMVHATPYIKILLWLVRPSRFPCGIWFEVISCLGNADDPLGTGGSSDAAKTSEKSWKRTDISRSRSRALVSFLRSNFLNIGQIVWPHYREVFAMISGSFVASSAYGVLTGRSIPPTLGSGLPSTMPWMPIPYKEYWRLCYDAVLGCEADLHRYDDCFNGLQKIEEAGESGELTELVLMVRWNRLDLARHVSNNESKDINILLIMQSTYHGLKIYCGVEEMGKHTSCFMGSQGGSSYLVLPETPFITLNPLQEQNGQMDQLFKTSQYLRLTMHRNWNSKGKINLA